MLEEATVRTEGCRKAAQAGSRRGAHHETGTCVVGRCDRGSRHRHRCGSMGNATPGRARRAAGAAGGAVGRAHRARGRRDRGGPRFRDRGGRERGTPHVARAGADGRRHTASASTARRSTSGRRPRFAGTDEWPSISRSLRCDGTGPTGRLRLRPSTRPSTSFWTTACRPSWPKRPTPRTTGWSRWRSPRPSSTAPPLHRPRPLRGRPVATGPGGDAPAPAGRPGGAAAKPRLLIDPPIRPSLTAGIFARNDRQTVGL